MKKRFAITVLALALTAGSAMTSFAAGFTGTGKGVKYQWGDGAYCTNNWVQYKNHWFYFGDDQLMRTGWIQKDGTWYYAADTGELQGGIMKINGNVYYFDTSTCKMVTEFCRIYEKTSAEPTGVLYSNNMTSFLGEDSNLYFLELYMPVK